MNTLTRRHFLQSASAAGALAGLPAWAADGFPAIVTRAVAAAEARGRELGEQLGRA